VIELDDDGVPVDPGPALGDLDPATTGIALTGDGRLTNSGSLNGMSKRNAIARVIEELEAAGTGRAAKTFRLRDWLISRQRFWGTPIPMIHTEDGRIVPVPEDQLPVVLPDAKARPQAEGNVAARRRSRVDPHRRPETGEPALRDADTMDTFVDSSWYFLRFLSPNDAAEPFSERSAALGTGRLVHRWCRARDPASALRTLHHEVPLRHRDDRLHRALLLAHQPGWFCSAGARCPRARETSSSSPPAWSTRGRCESCRDRLRRTRGRRHQLGGRVHHRRAEVPGARPPHRERGLEPHRRGLGGGRSGAPPRDPPPWADAPGLIEQTKFNVVIARLMELVNATRKTIDGPAGPADPAVREAAEALALILDLFAPHTAEEMWSLLGYAPFVGLATWRQPDPTLRRGVGDGGRADRRQGAQHAHCSRTHLFRGTRDPRPHG
jgi:leucyl-tRNA synthetase